MAKVSIRHLLTLTRPGYVLVFLRLRRFTLLGCNSFCTNLRLAHRFRHLPGAIAERGTWKGGMIAGLACVLGRSRRYYLFDSIEGLPSAKDIGGVRALRWQANTKSPIYFDNCRASVEDARAAMLRVGIHEPRIVKGWFENTLPAAAFGDGIAILRMDADWYDSTLCILNHLFPKVVAGGLVIIDDYDHWEGCSKAVHEFLYRNNRPERIRTFSMVVSFIVKDR